MKNIYFGSLLLLICSILQSMENTTPIQPEIVIESFQENRDMLAIEKILNEFPALTYESMGYAEGTTKKYLVSPKYTTQVLRVNNVTVGFINYTLSQVPFLLSWCMSQKGIVHLIGVDHSYQSKGYGKMLLHHALQDLKDKKMSIVVLTVKRENTIARKFYEKEGFVCTIPDTMPDKYREYLPDWIYEKNI